MKYKLFVKYYNLVFGQTLPTKMGDIRYDIIEDNNEQSNTLFLKKYRDKYPNACIRIYDCEMEKHKPSNKIMNDIYLRYPDDIRSVKLKLLENILC